MFFWRRVASQVPEDDLMPTATPGYMRNFRDLNGLLSEGKSFSGYEKNPLFLNFNGQGFGEAAHLYEIDFDDDSRAVAFQDWDHDGDLDLWITNRTAPQVRLLQNPLPASEDAPSISVRLIGNGTTTNRDAIGARLTLTPSAPSGPAHRRTLRAGDGFLTQSSSVIHFGLGQPSEAYTLQVAWPGGAAERFEGLQAHRRYVIRQGEPLAPAETVNTPRFAVAPVAPPSAPRSLPSETGFWVANRVPFPQLTFSDPSGAERTTSELLGRPLLINLWATWCLPCLKELAMLGEHAEAIQATGTNVLALNVDGLAVEGAAGSEADPGEVLSKVGYSLAHGLARQESLGKIDVLIEFLTSRRLPLSIPTSFLLDARGEVAAVYLEPVTWQQLERDLSLIDAPRPQQRARLTPRPGQWSTDPGQLDRSLRVTGLATRLAQEGFPEESQRLYGLAGTGSDETSAETFYNQAKAAAEQGQTDQAMAAYREALRLKPDYGQALTGLGALLLLQKQMEEARDLFERALRVDPNHATALINLAMIDRAEGDVPTALNRLRQVVARNPDFAEAHLNLGSLLASQNQLEPAISHLSKAVALQPQRAPAHLNLASAYLQAQRWQEAETHFRTTLTLNPKLGFAYEGLGQARAGQGHATDAINAYRQAVTLGRRTPQTFTLMGQAYLAAGDRTTARDAFLIALKMDPNHGPAKAALQANDLMATE